MTVEKDILGIVPGLQSMALVGENLKLLKQPKGKFKPKATSKRFIKTGVTNMVGVGMIGATASMINKL